MSRTLCGMRFYLLDASADLFIWRFIFITYVFDVIYFQIHIIAAIFNYFSVEYAPRTSSVWFLNEIKRRVPNICDYHEVLLE